MLSPVEFVGPCKGSVAVRIIGVLKATTDISVDSWIEFRHVDWLLVDGSGTIDGQGAAVWSKDDCQHNHRTCHPLPIVSEYDKIRPRPMLILKIAITIC